MDISETWPVYTEIKKVNTVYLLCEFSANTILFNPLSGLRKGKSSEMLSHCPK
jgi:hypothetical protein